MYTFLCRRLTTVVAMALAVSGLSVLVTDQFAAAAPSGLDTTSQAAVNAAYQDVYLAATQAPVEWTGGSLASCTPGTVSAATRQAQLAVINFYRGLAGLGPVTENAAASAQAQQAALIMNANQQLDHYPDSSAACWTQAGHDSAGKSNLAMGWPTTAGLPVDAWMDDQGLDSVGHRSWLLYPTLTQVGIGLTATYSALQWGSPTSGFPMMSGSHAGGTAWPAPGYLPYQVMPTARWSYSQPGIGFGRATVTVTKNGRPLPVSGLYTDWPTFPAGTISFPDPVLTWELPALTPPPAGGHDTYTVSIGGPVSVSYDVLVFQAGSTATTPEPGVVGLRVQGTAAPGATLQAVWDTLNPPGAVAAVQWYRDGQAIAGATSTHYTVGWADMCAALTVKVSARPPGSPVRSATADPVVPQFTDVPSGHGFYTPICWAATSGITKGSGGVSIYAPDNPVNRGSMAAFLYRLAGSPAWTAPVVSPFADVSTADQFYKPITWLYAQQITVGVRVGAKLYYQPDNVVNRGSMSAFLRRLAGSPAWTAPVVSPFADVTAANSQFYAPITWLANQRITVGTVVGDQTVYQPGNPVNRGSMAAFMARLAKTQLSCAAYPHAVGC
jgi:uncharacterized protein YkwD